MSVCLEIILLMCMSFLFLIRQCRRCEIGFLAGHYFFSLLNSALSKINPQTLQFVVSLIQMDSRIEGS